MTNILRDSDLPGFRVGLEDNPPSFRIGRNGEILDAVPWHFPRRFSTGWECRNLLGAQTSRSQSRRGTGPKTPVLSLLLPAPWHTRRPTCLAPGIGTGSKTPILSLLPPAPW